MMLFKKIGVVTLILFSCCRVNGQTSKYPNWLNRAIFYQIYPQSFKDSNGDGIGDINGLIEKLPYVKSLGINAIWINPCFESSFLDAGYDVTDYYKVASRYGTNADLKRLLDRAHELDLKVCLDLVAGHTSINHPWFVKSASSAANTYSDRYIWTSSKAVKPDKFVSGNYLRDGNYLKNFFESQPALNYGYANPNPKNSWEQLPTAPGPINTREELKNIIAYWMNMGADGFRVDMASSLIKNDPDYTETNKLWGNIRQWFSGKYPEGVLIAEWSNPAEAIRAGFMLDFFLHWNAVGYPSLFFEADGGVVRGKDPFFARAGKGSPTEFVNSYLSQKKSVGDHGLIALPTANHDFQRLRSGTRNSVDQLKVALAFLLTWQSIPFIYYGDEIGMKFIDKPLPDKEGSLLPRYIVSTHDANRAGTRTPMQWSTAKNAGFSTAEETKLYLPVDEDANRPTVDAQEKDKNSLLNFVRQLTALRHSNAALGNTGLLKVLYAKDKTYPLIFSRSNENEQFLICINPKDAPVTLNLPGFESKKILPVMLQSCVLKRKNGAAILQMQGISYGIYKVLTVK